MGFIETVAHDLRLRSFQNVMNLGSTDQVSELRVLKVVELQASQSCAIFGHLRTGRKCQVRAFQHVVNTARKTFPFRKLQLSPTSSHRDQSSQAVFTGRHCLPVRWRNNGGALHDAVRLVPLRWIVRVEPDLL